MMTPPTDEPDTITPKAYARRCLNQETTDDMQALNTAEEPNAATMLWERKIW